jgi:hypothetical protein
MDATPNSYKYLRRKPKSNYKQLWIFDQGRYVRARTVYGDHVNEESPRSVEEIAEDRDLPVEAVREAIAYCESDPPKIRLDWEMEEASMEASGINDPDYRGQPKRLPLGHPAM